MKVKNIASLSFFLICLSLSAQLKTDSLKYYLKHKEANVRLHKVTDLAFEWLDENPDTTLYYAMEANKSINKEVSTYNVGYNCHVVGLAYSNLSDYQSALVWFEKAYVIKKDLPYDEDLLITVNAIIYAWQGLGDIKQTHKYVLEAEQICERMAETKSVSYVVSLIQLADIYASLKRKDKAEEFFSKAVEAAEITKDDRQLNLAYQNYGSFLVNHGQYDRALPFIEKGLIHLKKLNEPDNYRAARVNLAIIYAEMGKKEEALKIFKEVYDQQLKGSDSYEKSSAANNLGYFYLMENKLDKALLLFTESLKYASEAKAFKLMMDRYQMLSQTYEQMNDFKSSLKYSRLFQKLNDSLFNVETVKQLNDLTEKYGNEKKEKKILELKKNNAEIKLKEEETKRKSQRNNIIFGSLILMVLIIAVFIYYSLVQKRKANSLLTLKNEQINQQHMLLEEKQKEILDSIQYAKRIQQSLMPTEKYIAKKVNELQKK